MEVLMMRQMTTEEIGLDMETVIKFPRFYSNDKVIEGVSKLYGYEQLLKELAQMVGEERWRQITEQLFPKESDNNKE
jgi:predicted secreted protein